jgi:hypothetical protein
VAFQRKLARVKNTKKMITAPWRSRLRDDLASGVSPSGTIRRGRFVTSVSCRMETPKAKVRADQTG